MWSYGGSFIYHMKPNLLHIGWTSPTCFLLFWKPWLKRHGGWPGLFQSIYEPCTKYATRPGVALTSETFFSSTSAGAKEPLPRIPAVQAASSREGTAGGIVARFRHRCKIRLNLHAIKSDSWFSWLREALASPMVHGVLMRAEFKLCRSSPFLEEC